MALLSPATLPPRRIPLTWVFPALLLAFAYGLLGLTFLNHSRGSVMQRCVLMDTNLSRIWSVGHVEIGMSYMGIFLAMVFYFVRMYGRDRAHLLDLAYALTYILGSFTLDWFCVTHFIPFVALLIGDSVVITFTVIVSRQLWFQRLLGVFVPLVFLTCGIGHMLEGVSYWKLTYPVNVPWTMVTADIGFAILVNAVRFPAFIRGQDVIEELAETKLDAAARQAFFHDVLYSVTDGHLRLCDTAADLPHPLPATGDQIQLSRENLTTLRHLANRAAAERGFTRDEIDCLNTAVGEAAMNAVVHGGGGEAWINANDFALQIWIKDNGAGIQMAQLPRATLERGFSTKDSLGHGFGLMLSTADTVHLLTGKAGTTLVISLAHHPVASSNIAA